MKGLKFLAFTCATFSITTLASLKPNLSQDPQGIKLSLSKNEERNATAITNFAKRLDRGKRPRRVSTRRLSSIRKSPLFGSFYPLLLVGNSLSARTITKDFYKKCSLKQENENKNISSVIVDLKRSCLREYLSKRNKTLKKLPLNDQDMKYLSANFDLLQGRYKRSFSKLIEAVFAFNDSQKEKIQIFLSQKFFEIDSPPPRELLPFLNINQEFTTRIQQVGLNKTKLVRIFTKEFRQITRSIYRNIKSKNFSKASTLTEHAISFHSENASNISYDRTYSSLVGIAKRFIFDNQSGPSNKILNYLLRISNNEDREHVYFYKLFSHFYSGHTKKTLDVIEKYNLLRKFDTFSTRLQFWISYSFEKSGRKELAQGLYQRIVNTTPLNFYSIIAYKEKSKKLNTKKLVSDRKPASAIRLSHFTKKANNSVKRLNYWIKTKHSKFIQNEFSSLISMNHESLVKNQEQFDEVAINNFLVGSSISLLNEQRLFLQSFKLIYSNLDKHKFDIDRSVVKMIFPKAYKETIKRADSSIDPLLILSLIRQESAFNPIARSHAGARGLMQLLPSTARQFNRRLKTRHLRNPSTNIKIGIKYLKKLISDFDGNLIYSLASYNAGEGNLAKWKRNIFKHDDPLITIESIPFRETRNYVKLIFRNLYFYKLLANSDDLDRKNLHESFKISYTRR